MNINDYEQCQRIAKILSREPRSSTKLAYAINCLPEWLRSYIHDLETRCDPAGEVAERWAMRQNSAALIAKVAKLEDELENAHGGQNTGDIEMASARLEETRAELRSLPDKHFRNLCEWIHVEMGCYVQQDATIQYPHTPWCVLDVDGEIVARGRSPIEAMEEAQRHIENSA